MIVADPAGHVKRKVSKRPSMSKKSGCVGLSDCQRSHIVTMQCGFFDRLTVDGFPSTVFCIEKKATFRHPFSMAQRAETALLPKA